MKLVLFLLLFGATTLLAAPPQPSSPWLVYKWHNSGQYKPNAAPEATFSFPSSGRNVAYPAFLSTTTITDILGNLTGQTVSATFSITVTGDPDFVWGGLLSGWNCCGLPANTRFFISDRSDTYSNANYTQHPNSYFWSQAWIEISALTGTSTITTNFDPSQWSQATGHFGSEPEYLAAFQSVVAGIKQIGLSFSGGSYYDCGTAILNGTGSSEFHLITFLAD